MKQDNHSKRFNNYHNPLEHIKKDNRPWLSEQQFKDALAQIESGDKQGYYNVMPYYRMKKEYREQLTQAFNKLTVL
jgi:hypothetical protein